MKRVIFFTSDRTGLTVETMAKSLLAQFQGIDYHVQQHTFIDNIDKAHILAEKIKDMQTRCGYTIIVFSTIVDLENQKIIESTGACVIDLFNTFIEPLEDALAVESAHTLGITHDVLGINQKQQNLDAIDFAMVHDDGLGQEHYEQGDIILVGVSRCGKTPTSLYLAMNFSLKVCNYPLTDNELHGENLPGHLLKHKRKLIGLTIQPEILQAIREKRLPGGDYAALSVCRHEVRAAEAMFKEAGLTIFDMTHTSIEETSGNIIKLLRNKRH